MARAQAAAVPRTSGRHRGGEIKEQRKKQRERSARYFDYSLLFFLIVLLGVGYVMLYSTSAPRATLRFDDSMYYLRKQVKASLLGFAGLIFCILINYHFFEKLAVPIYMVSLGLCVLVIFYGEEHKGSSRWLEFAGFSFQPSEVAKVALIIMLSAVIARTSRYLTDWKNVLKLFLFVVPMFGVVAVNNLSTALVIFGIGFVMIFIASKKNLVFIIVLAFAGVAATVAMLVPELRYRLDRVQIWLEPEKYKDGYQTLQGLYAIGSGGLFGKGLGESVQKISVLPEAQNDMIFSIICEELGLFGAVCIIILYILLLWRCLFIAMNARDQFGSYLVIGIMTHIALHVILNIAVVTNTLPNTGVTLPFISYGGSSIAILITEIGMVLSVSRGIQIED